MEELNSSRNLTQENDVDFTIERIVRSSTVILLSVIAILGHSIVIRTIPHLSYADMSGATKLLYRALSVADILTCAGLISGFITSIITAVTGRRSDIACKVIGLLMTCAPGTSAILILLLNLDRFICITRPLQYHSIVTRWKSAVAIAIAIPYISGFTTLYVLLHDRNLSVIREHKTPLCLQSGVFLTQRSYPYTLVMFSSNMWLVAVILIAMYSKIIMISRHHIARMNKHQKIANRVLRTKGNATLADEQDQVRSAAQHFDPSITRAFRQNIRSLQTRC
nr:ovarian cancer G-protein coupled receptor 1-like [Lytechinus pictus]